MISGMGKIMFERETLLNIYRSIGDGVIAVDLDNMVISMNGVAEEMTGLCRHKSKGKNISKILKILNRQEENRIGSLLAKAIETSEKQHIDRGAVITNNQGVAIIIEGSACPITDTRGDLLGAVFVFRNITEKIRRQKKIEHLLYYDPLTNIYRRRYLEKRFLEMDEKINHPISILVGDINNLRAINETFGRFTGDRVIKEMARILKKECGEGNVVARWGGNEFVVLMPNTGAEEVENIVGRINQVCHDTKIVRRPLSIAFGWDTTNSLSKSIERVFCNAEKYMYKKKFYTSPSVRGRTLRTVMEALFEKSPRERKHSERVSYYCYKIAEALNLSNHEKEDLKTIGLLHDIGKIIIKDDILEKKGELNEEEFEEMKKHSSIGFRILNSSGEMPELVSGILSHHERWDGKGYPDGLSGENIPLAARIIAIADSYDAMISERPYGRILSMEEACQEIVGNAGTQFDPYIAKIFAKNIIENDVGLYI